MLEKGGSRCGTYRPLGGESPCTMKDQGSAVPAKSSILRCRMETSATGPADDDNHCTRTVAPAMHLGGLASARGCGIIFSWAQQPLWVFLCWRNSRSEQQATWK
jgi:hypothetical protein